MLASFSTNARPVTLSLNRSRGTAAFFAVMGLLLVRPGRKRTTKCNSGRLSRANQFKTPNRYEQSKHKRDTGRDVVLAERKICRIQQGSIAGARPETFLDGPEGTAS